MIKTWTVYEHISPSGKVYIGITSQNNVNKRWRYGTGYHECIIFQKAIDKYGWNNIKHEVLFANLTEEKAKSLEIDLIRHYKNLGISYNITDGGDGTIGRKFTEEAILKMKKSHKGKKLSESHKSNMRIAQLNRTIYNISEKAKANIKAGLKSYYKTHDSHRKGISLSEEDKYKCIIAQSTRKPIIQYDINMIIVAEYPSISNASKVTGFTLSKISQRCKDNRIYKNYYWRYKNGE